MGINAAHSNFACLYCHIHKDHRSVIYIVKIKNKNFWCNKRWDITKECELRTSTTLQQCLSSQHSKGCIRPPLLNFELTDVIIDELHLMLRVTDVLLRNLIWAMIHMDLRDRGDTHLKALVNEIKSCGISFKVNESYTHAFSMSMHKQTQHSPKVWRPKDGSGGRSKDNYEWTSLRGSDKRKLLIKLPPKIPSLVPGGVIGERVKELWEVHFFVFVLIK